MRYPRPLSPDKDDAPSLAANTSRGGQGNEVSTAAPEDPLFRRAGNAPNTDEDQDQYLVEPRVWAGLTALQALIYSHESGMALPSRVPNIDSVLEVTSGSSYDTRKTGLSSQVIQTEERDTLGVNLARTSTDREPWIFAKTTERAEGVAAGETGKERTPSQGEDSEEQGGGGASETPTDSSQDESSEKERNASETRTNPSQDEKAEGTGSEASKIQTHPAQSPSGPLSRSSRSTASPSVSSKESSNRSRSSSSSPGSTKRSTKSSRVSECGRCQEAIRSGPNSGDGDTKRRQSRRRTEEEDGSSAVEYSEGAERVSSQKEAFCRDERSEEGDYYFATSTPHEGLGRARGRDDRGSAPVSEVKCEREGAHVRAADLEAGFEEARRLASLTSTACKELEEKGAALSR